jgi:hypothetical protein
VSYGAVNGGNPAELAVGSAAGAGAAVGGAGGEVVGAGVGMIGDTVTGPMGAVDAAAETVVAGLGRVPTIMRAGPDRQILCKPVMT